MKKVYIIILSIFVVALTSCLKESRLAKPVDNVTVNISYPADQFLDGKLIKYEGATATLKSQTRTYSVVTDANGVAAFKDIIPDIYTFSSDHILSAEEAMNLISPPAGGQDCIAKAVIQGINITYYDYSNDITVSIGKTSNLLISKVYFTGTKYVVDGVPKNYGAASTAYDAYMEIYNNSVDTVNTSGFYIASLDTDSTNPFADEKETYVYAKDIYLIPAVDIAPGKSIVIARQARDHRLANPPVPTSIDLTGADFETKAVKDPANPDVPIIPYLYHMFATLDYLHFSIKGGFTYILFKTNENPLDWPIKPTNPSKPTANLHIQVPANTIVDGLDVLSYTATIDLNKKRLPAFVDGSYGILPPEYSAGYMSVSLERKVTSVNEDGIIFLKDVNSTGDDFVWVSTDVSPRKYDKPELQPQQ